MRIVIFVLLLCFAFVPKAFSYSRWQLHSQRDSSQEWSGYYASLLVGGQFGRSYDETGDFGYNADNDKWAYNESGLNAGLKFGYSYPWQGVLVGPEIEAGYLNMLGSSAQPASPGGDTLGKTRSDFYTMFRARVGVDVNHYLLFVTGGAIGVNYTNQVIDNCNVAPCGGSTINATSHSYAWGYTLGGGIERMLSKSWSVQLEYFYFNLNKQNLNGRTNLGNAYSWSGQTYGNTVRGGVSYYF